MEEEVQQLKELVLQLRADNERLLRERAASHSALGGAAPAPSNTASGAPPVVTERLVVIPRDRRCPMFNGRSGISVAEWIEEIKACMRARHLSVADQALFIIDHLEGEAREEVRFRPGVDRDDSCSHFFYLARAIWPFSVLCHIAAGFLLARQQQEGETLQEFSLALLVLMQSIKQAAPDGMPNSEVLLRDQFVEHVF